MINEYGAVGGMRIGRGNQSPKTKPTPSSILFTTNPTWPDIEPRPQWWTADIVEPVFLENTNSQHYGALLEENLISFL
jgi:hypothetical protein